MRTYDLANMLAAFDESFKILIRLLDKGEVNNATIRARKMQASLHKVMGFLDCYPPKDPDKELIDKL